MISLRSHIAAIALCLATASVPASAVRADAKPDPRALAPTDITVDSHPVVSFHRTRHDQTQFGHLEFLGGLVLTSPDSKYFGGWSGLALDANGKDFAAVSDSGVWLLATLDHNGNAPSSVKTARLGPLLGLDGLPLKRSRDRDAEAVAVLSGSAHKGSVLIAFEQNSRLARHEIGGGEFSRALALLEAPRGSTNMRRNNGFEAMTVMAGGPHKGQAVAISERLYDAWRNHTGWIWTPRAVEPFHITNIGDFDVTDIASLDDGTLFVLERRFRWIEGVKMRIRRIAAVDLQPGRTITGETLFEADRDYEIDNMEGIAATRGPNGQIILTVLSDDNFNHTLQRTLLLQFAVSDVTAAKTRP